MKLSEAMSRKLNKICIEKNISINKLASMSCLTQSTIQNIVRICDGLGISLKDFYDDKVFDNIDRED